MTAPSNANTSGLSEAWSRLSKTFSDRFYEGYEPEIEAMSAAVVTAASAQARIDAAEAQADRLAKAARAMLDDYQTSDAHHPDHVLIRRTDFERIKALVEAPIAARAALQQETQP